MSNTAEIAFAIQNDRPSIMIRVMAQSEGNSMPNLRGMLSQIQEAITEYQAMPQAQLLSSSEGAVHYLSDTAMNSSNGSSRFKGAQNLSTKSHSLQTCKEAKITSGQLRLLKKTLRGLNRTDADFCQQYHLDRIENLPKEDARWIIRDLLETEKH